VKLENWITTLPPANENSWHRSLWCIFSQKRPGRFRGPRVGVRYWVPGDLSPQCEVDATRRTLPHSAEVKSAWCYTSSAPFDFVACTGTTRHAAHSSALNRVFPSLPQQLN
jgi:hypothetical protein